MGSEPIVAPPETGLSEVEEQGWAANMLAYPMILQRGNQTGGDRMQRRQNAEETACRVNPVFLKGKHAFI